MRSSNKLSRIRSILIAPDIVASLLIALLVIKISPGTISNEFSRDIYNVGITVLSIVFSVFFAALAIIISSGDDEFVDFLEQDGNYTKLISNFRFSLSVLLFALVYSLILYTITTVWLYNKIVEQSEYLFTFFVFVSTYGLLATFAVTNDAINYALYRTRFLRLRRENQSKASRKSEDAKS